MSLLDNAFFIYLLKTNEKKMRLTTLARKVAITPTKLTDFLEEKGVELTKGIHTKLDDLSVAYQQQFSGKAAVRVPGFPGRS